MAIVVGGVAVGVWELAGLAAAGVAALFFASPQGQEATREAARATAEALEKLRPKPEPEPEPEPEPRPPPPVPLPRICQDCPEQDKGCPPCVPPKGTVAYEVHRVPPQDPHFPCRGDHVHFFQRHQNPNNCQCFWKRNFRPVECLNDGQEYFPEPGMVPL